MRRSAPLPFALSLAVSLGLGLGLAACGGGDDDDDDHVHDAAGDDDDDATADGGDLDASAADAAPAAVEERDFTFGDGIFVEGSFNAGPGDAVRAIMTASAPALLWNIHGHVGDEVTTFHMETDVDASDFTFEPEAQAEYYFLIGNNAAEELSVTVRVELYGNAEFIDWYE